MNRALILFPFFLVSIEITCNYGLFARPFFILVSLILAQFHQPLDKP